MANPHLTQWATPNTAVPGPAIGHARYSLYAFSRVTPWCNILNSLKFDASTDKFICASSRLEHEVIEVARRSVEAGDITFLTYRQLFQCAEMLDKHVEEAKRVVIMIHIEPEMSADYALGLIMALVWARDAGKLKTVRVLTVSSRVPEYSVRRLLKVLGLPKTPYFVIKDGYTMDGHAETQIRDTVRLAERSNVDALLAANVRHLEGPQVIVQFSTDLVLEIEELEEWREDTIDDSSDLSQVDNIMRAQDGANAIIRTSRAFQPPIGLSGFKHIHVICESQAVQTQLDAAVGQLASLPLLVSKEERGNQFAWAVRHHTPPASITLYVDESEEEGEWWQHGPIARRLHVGNTQLGGFIASVASLASCNIDPANVAQCFVPEGRMTNFMTMASRLRTQRILKPIDDARVTMHLRGKELAVFSAVLPVLKYDHRLAYFVAQETRHPIVWKTKLQLASLISVGMKDLFKLKVDPLNPGISLNDAETLAAACRGYSKPLSSYGAMWMALGLWKCAVASSEAILRQHPVKGMYWLQVPQAMVYIRKDASAHILQVLDEMIETLERDDIRTARHSVAEENIEMNEQQSYEIQAHLLLAYISQLSFASVVNGKVVWKDSTSKRTINSFHPWMNGLFDTEKLRHGETNLSDCVFGIYHELGRDRDLVAFNDWTYIPTKVVAEWHSGNRPGERLTTALSDVGGPSPNADDTSKVWQARDW